MNKSEIRAEYKNRFFEINEKELLHLNKNLFLQVINSEEFKKARNILLFYGSLYEPETKDIIEYSLKNDKKIALPVCAKEQGIMEFYEIKNLAQLKTGAYNIMEPDRNICIKANIKEYEVCFVPGIFDRKGNRAGHGKGYYDRFLSVFSGIKAGLSFNCLLFDKIHNNKHDIPMDILFTDKGKTIYKQ